MAAGGTGIQPQEAGWIAAEASLRVQIGSQKEVPRGVAEDGDSVIPQPGISCLSSLPLQDFVV